MFCLKNDMELLRVESLDELSALEKATKYNFLEFDSYVYLDGFKTKVNKWIYLGTGAELSQDVYKVDNRTFENHYYASGYECASVVKSFLNAHIKSSNCFKEEQKFLCQKM